MHYLIVYLNKGKLEQKLFKDTTLEDALSMATKKGQILEVQRATEKGDPLEDVQWRHLYHF